MAHYINAIRAAAAKCCEPKELKNILDYLVDLAKEDYKAGALDGAEYGYIVDEYTDTLTTANVVNYL